MNRLMIPCIYLQKEKAVTGFGVRNLFGNGDAVALAAGYGESGADEILVFDFSSGDTDHEKALSLLRQICEAAEVPVIGAGHIRRAEDVKKLIYAGCARVVLDLSREDNVSLLQEVSLRFGKEKMIAGITAAEEFVRNRELIAKYAGAVLLLDVAPGEIPPEEELPLILHTEERDRDQLCRSLLADRVCGLSGWFVSTVRDIHGLKKDLQERGIPVARHESSIAWEDFKKGENGLVPVIVQDYKTDEVLMLAYMNEEAFDATVRTGKMTYWSRSRQELWVKGLTSGHFQYVKELRIDCDNDTILAKVDQIGAACHTGNRSCFYRTLVRKEYNDSNPLKVFQEVFDLIEDRKIHPKEGSYTNYLFDKGIDKILKKVGEEAAEIIIAAKNPDKDEVKYEISDFLYHMMVLMAEKGLTWDEVTAELARR